MGNAAHPPLHPFNIRLCQLSADIWKLCQNLIIVFFESVLRHHSQHEQRYMRQVPRMRKVSDNRPASFSPASNFSESIRYRTQTSQALGVDAKLAAWR